MDWLTQHTWEAWLALAVLLGAAELLSLDLILLMFAAGCVLGVISAVIGLPIAAQVLVAAAGSVAMLALVRPNVVRRLHGGPELVLGHNSLVGKTAVVVSEVSDQGGQIRIGGELWTARPYDETAVIRTGARVDVLQIKGATALVYEIPELDRPDVDG
ncbi:MAG TPA: NfeD family protein [Nocardioidaceae bacterium]|nr:NfeD family protein [Nocardioidaceae bacterium]